MLFLRMVRTTDNICSTDKILNNYEVDMVEDDTSKIPSIAEDARKYSSQSQETPFTPFVSKKAKQLNKSHQSGTT